MKHLLLVSLILTVLSTVWACALPVREAEPTPVASGLPAAAEILPPTVVATGTPEQPGLVEVTVYFTDSRRYAVGTPPFEAGVPRQVEAGADLPQAILAEFFRGPTETEQALGLEAITSGFTGFSELVIEEGTARAYLTGLCQSSGATYTIAQPIFANLSQFEEVRAIKIYDERRQRQAGVFLFPD